ncbi:MAG: response regulator transcription factor [Flavobacteriales bacterium]|nr:response regulator transcription factor [Flavobacteriales bacterium]
MIYAIAIDDEPLALDLIRRFANRNEFIKLLDCFTNLDQAIQFLQCNHVDLIFLDVQMPDCNGIRFYKKYATGKMVIFTTAHTQYAIDGFEVQAADYLLKPIKYDRFNKACERAQLLFVANQSGADNDNRVLTVRSEYSLINITLASITYMETMDDYIRIHVLDGRPIITLSSMRKMFRRLPEDEFIRIHRSYIVAFHKISSYRGTSIEVGGRTLPIGISYQKKVRLLLNNR